ncbi:putative ferric-chelate reductase 1 isoform X2 [Haliotis rufescens]|uniref:putative ferric-chelate reductase 1 isoform X2 n=1 Tax=Haliotis rufescens TaxID=6454 RepID=UPI00201F6AC9|nr:putative ferric-chelate reductase 1 isoform X2 [Haliotis rufescens]
METLTRHMLLCIGSLLLFARSARPYTKGAPEHACADMMPHHHDQPAAQTDSPFVLLLQKATYSPGEAVEVTLEGRCEEQFKGFLLQAHRADPVYNTSDYIGSFITTAITSAVCENGDGVPRGLTQNETSPKSVVKATWTAPSTASGHVIFKASFVKNYSKFWVRINSAVLTDPTAAPLSVPESSLVSPTMAPCTTETATSAPTDSTASVTQPPQSSQSGASASPTTEAKQSTAPPGVQTSPPSSISRDIKCGVRLGCFDDCDNGCTFSITWVPEDSNIRFHLRSFSTGDSWIAIGFSEDLEMGDDSVSECVVYGGDVKVFQSYNTGINNDRLAQPELGLSDLQGSVNNGIFDCSFLRQTDGFGDVKLFNLTQDWHLMFARGKATAGFRKSRHVTTPAVTSSLIDLQATGSASSTKLKYPLVQAHGCLMSIAWLFCASIGLVIARHFKPMWPDKNIRGLKVWFQIHRMCMGLTFVATVAAFIIIFIEAKVYSQINGEDYKQSHPVLGIIVTAMVLINPVMAYFRPGPTSERRPLFNWAHFLVGIGAYCIAVINIFFGLKLSKSGAPDYMVYVLAGYVVWQLITEISLEALQCLSKQKDATMFDGIPMQNKANSNPSDKPLGSTQVHYVTLKHLLLGLHVCLVTGFTATVVILLL